MKTYIGTKIIRAMPMTRLAYNEMPGRTMPADENPDDEGYLVEYQDGGEPNVEGFAGYVSWSPAEQFEKAYRSTTGLTFGQAIEALKAGKKVARIGWNGSGQFVYLVPAASYPAQTGISKAYFGADAMVPYRAYLALKTAQGDVAIWAPSCSDSLAEDWQIIE